ncbi:MULTISPECIES: DUF6082 family protein [unclassified Streptomyces]|uniref:DUF6082 family protein n=1 Tax=unclassified Streptomyces TaxID=2593676 RepID=UPI0035DB17B5
MATQSNGVRGIGSALLTAAALMGAALALTAQRRRLEEAHLRIKQLEQEELARQQSARAQQQRVHWELSLKAIDDPSLAAVINTYDSEIPPGKVRQFFFANAWYVNLFHLDQAGVIGQEDLYGRLRDLFQSPVFREYWRASRNNRATLRYSSDEARLGRLADRLLEELEEADTEEWWVVGDPPTF